METDKRTVPESARMLAGDLNQIRRSRQISIEDIYWETRIPQHVLDEFESTLLYGHALLNPVYLRAMIRSYAVAVGLNPRLLLSSVNDACRGTYTGLPESVALAGEH
jgi:cytoskeletal protein RodZ